MSREFGPACPPGNGPDGKMKGGSAMRTESVRKAAFLLAGVLLLCLLAGAAWGNTYDIEKELELYGDLDQHDVPGFGAVACGPTAAVNSFVYLQNKYPGIYDTLLVPDINANGLDNADMIAVAQTLGGAVYMNTIANNTTYHDDFIWGKREYIEDKAPGRTEYLAQDSWNWPQPARPKPTWVSTQYPTWDFIYDELVACEDVEVLLSWSGGGHYLTLSSFHWADTANPGVIDLGEAWIDYMDPWTGAWGQSNIWSGSGRIETDYESGAYISMAVSESPIPEPISLVFFSTGVAAVMGVARRKRKAA